MDAPSEPTNLATARIDPLAPGQVLGNRYRIRNELGRGGMGNVWRAYDLKLRLDVALKALRGDLLQEPRALETLRQEVRTAREVVSPNVCRVFDLVEIDGRELVSMEYVDGLSLRQVLAERSPLDLQEAREIASQFLAGLQAIHEAGLVHRDLKPENLMMTRSGRVVVMDFGIAKGLAEPGTGTVSGTPAYMAPEQARGETLDARADIFAAGVVLAEVIAPTGVRDPEARGRLHRGLHTDPPQLPDTVWRTALRKAVAQHPEKRYASAAALSRALDELTLRVEGAEDVRPYPGLASFTQDDAEYFFGRELEVEAMWRKLRRPNLLALIGPSGAGKSSFLRAGLLPAIPQGWRAVICTPGNRPFASLAQAMAPELTGDLEAIQQLPNFDQPDAAVSVIRRWRSQHDEAVVIVDQFEELFTQNLLEVETSFSTLLAQLALDADVHVLLSLRDDFLFRCSAQSDLQPIFTDLTPLRPPTGAALRRAVVQPALKCGYRFEDESLVNEILGEVENERGALPMLAFACARLWEHRDREQGVLTREAYARVGGVGGALAQHAEAVLERIGTDKLALVREIFRNLVTSQGTRAAQHREELLSVFGANDDEPDRKAAGHVLDALVDARLLTAYDLETQDEGKSHQQRLEIIHESLLTAWPRLVRWQTQDADSAQFRDQLRQAARLWDERNRPADLLWTGTSFREYQLWRESYVGGLTAIEEEFARATTARAQRRRRQRRIAAFAGISTLLVVLAVVGALWRQSVTETRRAEAAKLFALAQLEIQDDPTVALAYATASLRLADEPHVRHLALRALWSGPMVSRLPKVYQDRLVHPRLDFSPDEQWLTLQDQGTCLVIGASGGAPRSLVGDEAQSWRATHSGVGSSELAVLVLGDEQKVQVYSRADGRRLSEIGFEAPWASTHFLDRGSRLLLKEKPGKINALPFVVDVWEDLASQPRLAHRWEGEDTGGYGYEDVDPTGRWFAHGRSNQVVVVPVEGPEAGPELVVGRHDETVSWVRFHPEGRILASGDFGGEVRLWSFPNASGEPLRTLAGKPDPWGMTFDPTGSRFVLGYEDGSGEIWNLEAPPDADPLRLEPAEHFLSGLRFVGSDHAWLAGMGPIRFWSLHADHPSVLRGHSDAITSLMFTSDGRWIVSSSNDGTVRMWPLSPEDGLAHEVVYDGGYGVESSAVDPHGRVLILSEMGTITALPLEDGPERDLPGFQHYTSVVADETGSLAAGIGRLGPGADLVARVWDLQSGDVLALRTNEEHRFRDLAFTPDGRLLSGMTGGELRSWDLSSQTYDVLRNAQVVRFCLTRDGRRLLAIDDDGRQDGQRLYAGEFGGVFSFHDLDTGESRILPCSGRQVTSFALDPDGEFLVLGNAHGSVHVSRLDASEPTMLLGHDGAVSAVAVSSDGQWIASGGWDGAIRVWSVPDLSQPPLHTLPREALLERLQELTNLRATPDRQSSTGWSIVIGEFPGWNHIPTWQW